MPPEWLFVLSRGGGGEPLINMGPKKLFPVVYWRTLTHKVVPCTHTVVVCVVKRGGEPLVNMGSLKLFSSSFLRGIDPRSSYVYPQRSCLCYEGVWLFVL